MIIPIVQMRETDPGRAAVSPVHLATKEQKRSVPAPGPGPLYRGTISAVIYS